MAQNHLGSTSSFTDRRAKSHNRRRSSVSLSLGADALTPDQARSSSQHLAPQPLSPIPGTYLPLVRRGSLCSHFACHASPLCVSYLFGTPGSRSFSPSCTGSLLCAAPEWSMRGGPRRGRDRDGDDVK